MRICKPIVLSLVLFLSSCGWTPQGDIIRETIKNRGAQSFDEGLESSEWFICKGASFGAVERRYGRSKKLADAHQTICKGEEGVSLIRPAT
jgi:hypothetical protein